MGNNIVFDAVKTGTVGLATAVVAPVAVVAGKPHVVKNMASETGRLAKRTHTDVKETGDNIGDLFNNKTAALSLVCGDVLPGKLIDDVADDFKDIYRGGPQNKFLGVRTCYHNTTCDAAKSIIKEQKFRKSWEGELGGGTVYFARTPKEAVAKSGHHYRKGQLVTVLACDVNLGLCRGPIPEVERDWKTAIRGSRANRGSRLQDLGYNSIALNRNNGIEYAVWDARRVTNIRQHSIVQIR